MKPRKPPAAPKHVGMDEWEEYQRVMGRPPGPLVDLGWSLTVGRFTLTMRAGKMPVGSVTKLRTITRRKP